MQTIESLAQHGEQYDVMTALKLLTIAYMEMCGISKGFRTVVFYAADEWQNRLASMNLPLSEMAKNVRPHELMPYITEEYNPEIYDEYDIAIMQDDELLDCCRQIVEEKVFDEPTTEVLCWGFLNYYKSNRYKIGD